MHLTEQQCVQLSSEDRYLCRCCDFICKLLLPTGKYLVMIQYILHGYCMQLLLKPLLVCVKINIIGIKNYLCVSKQVQFPKTET